VITLAFAKKHYRGPHRQFYNTGPAMAIEHDGFSSIGDTNALQRLLTEAQS
jgi:hypothetical protein